MLKMFIYHSRMSKWQKKHIYLYDQVSVILYKFCRNFKITLSNKKTLRYITIVHEYFHSYVDFALKGSASYC